MKAPPASSLPKGKGGFDLFYGLNIAQRCRGRICSPGASTSLEGEGGLYLFISGASASLEGEEDLFVLWPQHRSKAQRAYLTCTGCPRSRRDLLWVSSACLNTWGKNRALVPTPMKRPIQQRRIIHGVSKTPRRLGSPLLQNFLLSDAHARRKRPPSLPCEVSKHQTPGLAIHT